MYLKQKDIFGGMDRDIVKKIMKIAITESHQKGEWLFRAGDPASSLVLFKRLAAILGNRLLQSYAIISSTSPTAISTSYGTGQAMAFPETEPA